MLYIMSLSMAYALRKNEKQSIKETRDFSEEIRHRNMRTGRILIFVTDAYLFLQFKSRLYRCYK